MRRNLEPLKYSTLAPEPLPRLRPSHRVRPARGHPADSARTDRTRAGRRARVAEPPIGAAALLRRGSSELRPRGRAEARPTGTSSSCPIPTASSARATSSSIPSCSFRRARTSASASARGGSPRSAPASTRRRASGRSSRRGPRGAVARARADHLRGSIRAGTPSTSSRTPSRSAAAASPIRSTSGLPRPRTSRASTRASAAIPAADRFFLIDLSSLGTTLNGRHVPARLRHGRRQQARERHRNVAARPGAHRAGGDGLPRFQPGAAE